MLERFKSLFGGDRPKQSESLSLELAVAALLVEAARADEDYTDLERALVDRAIADQFSLDDAGARSLRLEAEAAQAEAHDIHRFTKIAKSMPREDKLSLLERLWTVILSDGVRDPHEDTMVRRVCGLIYISDVESGAARRRAESALQTRGRPA